MSTPAQCCHPKCAEIEGDFIAGRSPEGIAEDYGLADRASIYRHADALGLFAKRQRNIRAAPERIIEHAGLRSVAAVEAYSKINAAGQWVERSEHVHLNELFERMTTTELEACARNGSLPQVVHRRRGRNSNPQYGAGGCPESRRP